MSREAISKLLTHTIYTKLRYIIKTKALLALLILFCIPSLSTAAPAQSITIIADGSGEAILVDGSKLLKGTIKDNGSNGYQIQFQLVGGSPSVDTQGVYASISANDSMLVRSGQMIKGKTTHYGNNKFQTVFTSNSNSINSNVFLAAIALLVSLLIGLGIMLYRVNNKVNTYRESNYKHQELAYNLRIEVKNLRDDKQFRAPKKPQDEKVQQAIQNTTLPEFKNIKFKESYLQDKSDDANLEENKV